MSATASNPDRRPLPDGWITRWDDNYRAWYYVDTRAQPPRSSWDHPLNQPPSTSPPGGYAPPSSAPPPNRNYGVNAPTYNQPSQSYPEQPPYGGFPSGAQDSRNYPQPGQQGYVGPSSTTSYRNTGWQQPGSGWQQPQQGYAQAPPAAQQQQHGGRNALLAGGAGLLGGALLMEGFEHHERREEDRAYEEGREQGYDQGFDNAIVDDNNFGGGGGW